MAETNKNKAWRPFAKWSARLMTAVRSSAGVVLLLCGMALGLLLFALLLRETVVIKFWYETF